MRLTSSKNYTEPKISPAKPESSDMQREWYVWFRFFDAHTETWKQLRYKKGINEFKVYKQRLAEANALRQALKQELQAGWNPLEPEKVEVIQMFSISECIKRVREIKEATLRKKTITSYRYITGMFLEWIRRRNLSDTGVKFFNGRQAQEYMDWLLIEKKYVGRTFNDHLIVLRTFFNAFIDREWINTNPFRSVKKKSQVVGRNLAYTDQELEQLHRVLKAGNIRMYYLTQFMFHTFIRRTEMTHLQIKHIDLINGTIVIPGEAAKNNHQETVVIPKGLLPVIDEMQLHKYPSEYYIFGRGLQTCAGRCKSPDWISFAHNEYVKMLGFDESKGLYSHKHTGVCAYYYATNKDIYSLMRQLRHRDLKTTMIYLKSMGLVQNETFRNAMTG